VLLIFGLNWSFYHCHLCPRRHVPRQRGCHPRGIRELAVVVHLHASHTRPLSTRMRPVHGSSLHVSGHIVGCHPWGIHGSRPSSTCDRPLPKCHRERMIMREKMRRQCFYFLCYPLSKSKEPKLSMIMCKGHMILTPALLMSRCSWHSQSEEWNSWRWRQREREDEERVFLVLVLSSV
jgi:hypothetical protein